MEFWYFDNGSFRIDGNMDIYIENDGILTTKKMRKRKNNCEDCYFGGEYVCKNNGKCRSFKVEGRPLCGVFVDRYFVKKSV